MGRQVSALACAVGLVTALFGAGCGSSSVAASGCKLDKDCAVGQICVTGACQASSNAGGSGGSGGTTTSDGGTPSSAGTSASTAGTAASTAGTSANGDAGAGDTAGTGGGAGACLGRVTEPTASQHCVCQDDCDEGGLCADEASSGFPGGMCLTSCKQTPCDSSDLCVEITPGDPTTSTCVIPCTASTECPIGLICQNATVGGPLFCFPLCQSDADCPTLGKCDRYTGVCGEPDPNAGPGDVGVACAGPEDCQSDFCVPPSSFAPGGLCTAFCALSHDGCPTGSACTNNWSDVGDEGICFQKCAADTDCRTGYRCGKYAGTPSKVCAPIPT